MWRLVIRPQVEDNLVEAFLWHDKKQIGLGDQFLDEYVTEIYRILENPSLFSIAGNGLRPCVIKRFSYFIHFVIEDDQIIVIAALRRQQAANLLPAEGDLNDSKRAINYALLLRRVR
jgi:hypothetical protein